MTSVFQVIAHEDNNDQSKVRKAMALANQRVEDRFGSFVRTGSVDDQAARFSLVEEDVKAVVAAACNQVGFADADSVYASIARNFVTGDATPQLRTASVRHEARKPKMCPYHSEVTDISLAQGEPQAGFNAMAQHAWSERHCQGDKYEGGKCNFKPAMTTQAFWDEKAEKAEQRKQEREEQAQLQAEQDAAMPVNEIPEVETPEEEFVDGLAETDTLDAPAEPSAVGEGVEEPVMLMAASVKTADKDNLGGSGEPNIKMDKRKWTPKTVNKDQPLKADDPNGRNPTKRKDVVAPITQTPDEPDNKGELKEIGEQVTEHQDVTQKSDFSKGDQGGSEKTVGPSTAVSSLLSTASVREALSKFKRD